MNLRRIAAGCVLAVSATLLTLTAASPASADTADDAVTPCPAVEVISVRGSGAKRNDGDFSLSFMQAQNVRKASDQNVRVFDLPYRAVKYNPADPGDYADSVSGGVANLRARIDQVSTNCPRTKIAIVGYSQGAQVTGNALDNQPVPGGRSIAGIVFFGDPKFNNQTKSYNVGTYTQNNGAFNGVFGPRPKMALDTFADRLRSYCRADDEVCQAGGPGGGHDDYRPDQATGFLVNKIGG